MKRRIDTIRQFIKEFLPPLAKQPRRGEQIEITYVAETVRRAAKNHLQLPDQLENPDVLKILKDMGYPMKVDNTSMRGQSNKPGQMMNTTFIGVSSADVVKLRNSCGKVMPNTSEEKKAEIEELIQRIEAFKQMHLA